MYILKVVDSIVFFLLEILDDPDLNINEQMLPSLLFEN